MKARDPAGWREFLARRLCEKSSISNMDAFYDSVRQRDDPQVRSTAVIVAWPGNRRFTRSHTFMLSSRSCEELTDIALKLRERFDSLSVSCLDRTGIADLWGSLVHSPIQFRRKFEVQYRSVPCCAPSLRAICRSCRWPFVNADPSGAWLA